MKKNIIKYIKKIFFLIEGASPSLGRVLIKFFRKVRYFYHKILFSLNKNEDDVFKICYVETKKIANAQLGKFDMIKDRGAIKDGDWDKDIFSFKETDTYKGMHERFIQNKEWKETNHFHKFSEKIKNGEIVWNCNTEEKLLKYLGGIDNLHKDIKKNGYKLNTDSDKIEVYSGKNDRDYEKIDEITLSIDGNGHFLFNDGAHRLAIAKILNIKEVPAMILIRHKKWQDFKNKFYGYAKNLGGDLYQQAYHPDLTNMPYVFNDERFKILKDKISPGSKTILDIGANLGNLCHSFEKIGLQPTALEVNPQDVYFMKGLRDACGDKYKIFEGSVFEYKKNQPVKADVVLALNIFHHFIKRKPEHERLINFLGRIESNEMYFESHNPNEDQMENVYKNYAHQEFVDFIISNSCYTKSEKLKEFSDGRILYRISK